MSPRLGRRVPLIAKLGRARELSGAEWIVLFQASALLLGVELGLRLLPLRALLVLLDRWGRSRRLTRGGISPARIALLVGVMSRAQRATCLRQALALYGLLRRRGFEARLVVGAEKAGGELEAHAWVEYRGQVLPASPRALELQPLLRWGAVGLEGHRSE